MVAVAMATVLIYGMFGIQTLNNLNQGDIKYTRHRGQFCVGCFPGPPLWSGKTANVSACEKMCSERDCACFDFASEGKERFVYRELFEWGDKWMDKIVHGIPDSCIAGVQTAQQMPFLPALPVLV